MSRVTSRDFGMEGDTFTPIGEWTHGRGQGSEGGDWCANCDKIWRGQTKARNMNKKGVKWLFYPLFGKKLAEFVLFLMTIIYIFNSMGVKCVEKF